jgi:hypothetical protein
VAVVAVVTIVATMLPVVADTIVTIVVDTAAKNEYK